MTAVWAWVQTQKWLLWLVGVLLILAAILALVFQMRRAAEAAGRQAEKLEQQRRAIDAEKRARAIPRPTADDVDKRLRDGTF